MNDYRDRARLAHVELAAIDLTITALEAAGHTINDVSKDDNPRQQMAEAWADAHHPQAAISDHDREILGRIKALAGELKSRTSLRDLLVARGKLVQGP